MELNSPRVSFDPFWGRIFHTRHPEDLKLDNRVGRSSQPFFTIPLLPPSCYAYKREDLDRTYGSIGSPRHSSQSNCTTRSDVKSSYEPQCPSDAGGKANAAPAKRPRALDDVDGPGTAKLSVKKRRLLLRLVTSRLSHPFSLPATNILIRERGNNIPVLHRIQNCIGARRIGHQSALIRKAAILNRARMGARTAAISRGHVIMADLATRGSALDHGLLLITTPAPAMFHTGVTITKGSGNWRIPPTWRPHTTSFHLPFAYRQHYPQQYNYGQGINATGRFDLRCAAVNRGGGYKIDSQTANVNGSATEQELPLPALRHASSTLSAADVSDEEDNTAFPAASFQDRYADVSDDDVDDVYADFGVLFGSGARSQEARPVGNPAEEQFYEEYLDELDGIPWIM